MGCGVRFQTHAGGKQCVFSRLVAAGFGITLATTSQSEVVFPDLVYRPIREENAWVQVELVWCPDAEDPAVGRFVAFMRDGGALTSAFSEPDFSECGRCAADFRAGAVLAKTRSVRHEMGDHRRD